jgi:hypothetical protein
MSSVTDRLSGQFCASMLVEARAVANDEYPSDKQDIFMEDGMQSYKYI